MGLFKKKDAAAQMQEAVQEAKNDGKKKREFSGKIKVVVSAYAMAITLFHILGLTIMPLDPFLFRSISLMSMAALAFLMVPASKKSPRNRPTVYDLFCVALAFSVMIYIAIFYVDIYYRAGFRATTPDVVFALFCTFCVIEMTRRLIGWTLPVIAGVFVAYALFGSSLPGVLGHRGYELDRLLSLLLSTEGFFGSAMSAAANYIVLFVTFAAFLTATGVGEFFTRFATALAGRFRGGPAKVAIVSSALMGTVSGSAMGNVVATGSFTIPLMKKTGYSSEFAGAVEAAASTGGQIMPPVMGAVAFVLAEYAGVPYHTVMSAAIIPAIVYFLAVFFMVDFQAVKLKLVGVSKELLPNVRIELITGGYLLIPLIVFVLVITVFGRSIIMGALVAIALSIALSWVASLFVKTDVAKESRVGPKKAGSALMGGALGSMEAVAACGTAGIVVGVMALTGLAQRLGAAVMDITQGNLPLTLVAVMVFCIILGMGMPTVPAYILAASVGTPTLIAMGVDGFVAHMFCMYFATISTITPPVALAGYAAAGIANANPAATSWQAMKLGLSAYIVPFVFVYSNELLWMGNLSDILLTSVTAAIGAYSLAGAIGSDFNPVLRLMLGASAITLIIPGIATDVIGIALLVAAMLLNWLIRKRKTKATA